jgi:hypothetical protein
MTKPPVKPPPTSASDEQHRRFAADVLDGDDYRQPPDDVPDTDVVDDSGEPDDDA